MSQPSLISIANRYFAMRGYTLENSRNEEEYQPRRFDLVIHKGNEAHPVWIKDWNRTVGVNIVINIDKMSKSVKYSGPILVAEKFSEHAKAYANRRGIKLITKSEMRRDINR